MTENNLVADEITSLENVFKELDTRRISIEERIRKHENFLNQLKPGSSTVDILKDSKTQKQSEKMVDNPFFLLEIKEYTSSVLDSIKDLKKTVERERNSIEKITYNYKVTRHIAECFSALEKLDLTNLEDNINKLGQLDPDNILIRDFRNDLKKLQKVNQEMGPERWQELRTLGSAIWSGSLSSEEQKQLMVFSEGHTDVSIFSQWYQLSRLALLERKESEFMKWEKLHMLNTAIQDAHFLQSKRELLQNEDHYWEVLGRLEEKFIDKSFLDSLAESDGEIKHQWLAAIKMIINCIIEIEEKQRVPSKKRKEQNKQWKHYLETRGNILVTPAGKPGNQ